MCVKTSCPQTHVDFHIRGLSRGYDLGYRGPQQNAFFENNKSAASRPEVLIRMILEELEAGRFLGPYPYPPFPIFRVNPMGLVPKAVIDTFRMIVDLSRPTFGSVNFYIPEWASSVTYPTVQDAIDIILDIKRRGLEPVLFKYDIRSAFRLLPIAPEFYPLLGLYHEDIGYLIDAALPMGSSSSCQLFQSFSDLVKYLMINYCGADHINNYLDDFLGIHEVEVSVSHHFMADPVVSYPSGVSPEEVMENIDQMGEDSGIPFCPKKRAGPGSILDFLGKTLDCIKLEARLPPEKIKKALDMIIFVSQPHRRCNVCQKVIQSIHGFLQHCADIIPIGKVFLRSLGHLLAPSESGYVALSAEILEDLRVWEIFLRNFNGRAMFVRSGWAPEHTLIMQSDASTTWGCSAILLGEYIAVEWPDRDRSSLSLLEFYPIVLATFVWADRLRNQRVTMLCDNQGTCEIINDLKSSSADIMYLVRIFALQCLNLNLWFQAEYLSTHENTAADLLSRGKFVEYHAQFEGEEVAPVIPPCLDPMICLPPLPPSSERR